MKQVRVFSLVLRVVGGLVPLAVLAVGVRGAGEGAHGDAARCLCASRHGGDGPDAR